MVLQLNLLMHRITVMGRKCKNSRVIQSTKSSLKKFLRILFFCGHGPFFCLPFACISIYKENVRGLKIASYFLFWGLEGEDFPFWKTKLEMTFDQLEATRGKDEGSVTWGKHVELILPYSNYPSEFCPDRIHFSPPPSLS